MALFAHINKILSWRYDLPVVLIFTIKQLIPVIEYGNTFLKNLKKNVFPEVKTKKYAQYPLTVYISDVKMETTICARSGDDIMLSTGANKNKS